MSGGYLRKLPLQIQRIISLAGDTAERNNLSAYLVGGFVRDLILGKKNLDLDIVVEGDGIKFAENLARDTHSHIIIHKRFGTATLKTGSGLKVDIATARSEIYRYPAHLPEVRTGSLKDDLFRRDFTINAMAMGITGVNSGNLIDFYGGKRDLSAGKIRVLHDLSFMDDPTRILRAIRFEQRYNFRIEKNTLSLLREAKNTGIFEKVQPHRLRDEFILSLKEERPLKEIKRIQELTGFGFLDRDLCVTKRGYGALASLDKEIRWFKQAYPKRRSLDSWLVYFMGLIDQLPTGRLKLLCRRFSFLKGEEKRIMGWRAIKADFISLLKQPDLKPSRIFSLLEPLSYEVIIMIKAKFKDKNIKKHIEDFFEIYNGMRLCISGKDIKAMGISPGPYYRKIFSAVLKAKLNGEVKDKEEEFAMIRKLTAAMR
ncbi:MAG: hypothetical protein WC510_03700 [Candidatus Omnitrophota bacterium]